MTAQAKIARFYAGYRVLPPEKQAEIRGMAEAFGAAQEGVIKLPQRAGSDSAAVLGGAT
jgi:hypothetical protein